MASNVSWSAIYLGNLAEMDTDESDYAVETDAPILATFGVGPGNALARNIVTLTTQGGSRGGMVTTDNVTSRADPLRYDLGDGPVTTEIDAGLLVNGTVTFYDQTQWTADLPVIQDVTGNVFLLVMDDQPELASQGIDSVIFHSVVKSNYAGVNQYTKDDHAFVCLTAGALIETPGGAVRMDRLRVGERVTTLDHGPQPILWIGKRRVVFSSRPDPAQPVMLRRDALAPGRPTRDLLLSPEHRLLVETSPAFALHDPLGALAPAKALIRQTGLRQLAGRRAITYFALLLPRHEVIVANGVAVESLYPGPEVFARLDAGERGTWMGLAAAQGRLTGGSPARLLLTPSEARAGLAAGWVRLPRSAPRPLAFRRRTSPEHALPVQLRERLAASRHGTVQASSSASQ